MHHRRSVKLGIHIPAGVFGEGLWIVHPIGTVVSKKARIGRYCHIYQNVTIGENFDGAAPKIGDYATICAGAVIIGGIRIGNNVIIGANSVVTRSFEEDSVTIAGNPARIVSKIKVDRKGDALNSE